ncbi:MAG: hypothetical protein NTX65_02170 [Ignavibacteriales bacterium]|nr:hypothetical protein [Ignavibacteriales bacterium]
MFDSTFLDKKVMKSIAEMIDKSVPKNEIYQHIIKEYPNHDHDYIAKGIASFINDNIKSKNKIHSYILSIFVILSLNFCLILFPNYAPTISKVVYWGTAIIYFILTLFLVNGILRFKLAYYTTAVSYYLFWILSIIFVWLFIPFTIMHILLTIGIMITYLYIYLLRKHIFPNIDFWGNVKKEKGNYIF